ncbi:MAG: hypothetical protein R6V44_16525 [Paracoccaceae bacterium]
MGSLVFGVAGGVCGAAIAVWCGGSIALAVVVYCVSGAAALVAASTLRAYGPARAARDLSRDLP